MKTGRSSHPAGSMLQVASCVRGCVRARRHVTTCPDHETCTGCLPRDIEAGSLLCTICADRLRDWLDTAYGQALYLHAELGGLSGSALRSELESRRGTDANGPPASMNLSAYVCIADLTDVLLGRTKLLCDEFDMRGPEAPLDIAKCAKFLRAQITRLMNSDDIAEYFSELGEVMGRAHAVAPWREAISRLKGIPCPCCHRVTLAHLGGEENVTCLHCNESMPPSRYAIWVRIITADRAGHKHG